MALIRDWTNDCKDEDLDTLRDRLEAIEKLLDWSLFYSEYGSDFNVLKSVVKDAIGYVGSKSDEHKPGATKEV